MARMTWRQREMSLWELNMMQARYEEECIDYPPRMETEKEKKERLLRKERERRAEERKKVIKP